MPESSPPVLYAVRLPSGSLLMSNPGWLAATADREAAEYVAAVNGGTVEVVGGEAERLRAERDALLSVIEDVIGEAKNLCNASFFDPTTWPSFSARDYVKLVNESTCKMLAEMSPAARLIHAGYVAEAEAYKQDMAEIERLRAEVEALQDIAVTYREAIHGCGWLDRATGTLYPTKAKAVASHRRAAGLDKGDAT